MSTFDVWVIRFEPGEAPPAERLQAAFGMDFSSARALEQSVPKIVQRAVPAKAAGEMRLALEAIGAVVECRPARHVNDAARAGRAAVFHRPKEDLLPSNPALEVDRSSRGPEAEEPELLLDESVRLRPAPKSVVPSDTDQPRRITASLLATSRSQQRRKFLQQATATIVAGAVILVIDWFLGNSVLRGDADWIGIGIDGLGIYFVGVGIYDLVTTLRS